jgi:hypothetical protein
LEGFAATLLQEDAVRVSMQARVEVDHRLTARDVLPGTDRSLRALLSVDTGVLRPVDPGQWTWLRTALDRARDQFPETGRAKGSLAAPSPDKCGPSSANPQIAHAAC